MDDVNDPQPGDPGEIAGYRVVGRLGEGGQGVVFLATGPAGERVAIKRLRADLLADDRARRQLVKEVAAARRVAPFCTARVVDANLDGPDPYVISEYIEGPSLQQHIERNGPVTGGALQRMAIGTVTALAAIHVAGVVHRDFKPANVMLAPDGPRVIDFGIARDLSAETTVASRVLGTPAYMAPEQFRAEPVGPATDMFAWASVIVLAATGRAPFEAPHMAAVMNRITAGEPDLTGVPAYLLDLLNRCLDKDPARRPSAQQALAHLLGRPEPERDQADPTMALTEATHIALAETKFHPGPTYVPGLGRAHTPDRGGRTAVLAVIALVVVLGGWGLYRLGQFDGGGAPLVGPTDASAGTVPEGFAGRWVGEIRQPAGQDPLWTARVELVAGAQVGRFELAELGCSGTATVTSASSDRIDFVTRIDHDPAGACAPAGTGQLTAAGPDQALMSWQDAATPTNTADGLLTRS